MKSSLAEKIVAITPPGVIVDNAPFVTAAVDTAGFGQLTIVLLLGALDVAPTVMKLQESNDSGMTGAVDIAGAAYGTDTPMPTATDDNKMYAFHVDLRGRKRYIDFSFTGGDGATGTYAVAFAILSRGQEMPNTAAKRGYAAELFV